MMIKMKKMIVEIYHKQIVRSTEDINSKWNRRESRREIRTEYQQERKLEKWLVV